MKRYGQYFVGYVAIVTTTLLLCAGNPPAQGADRLVVDDIMRLDPEFVLKPIKYEFSSRLKPLWARALSRPDGELQRLAADSIASAAQRGMEGLEDAALELVKVVESPEKSANVRYAAARAIVALDADETAEQLAQCAAEGNLQLAQVIEPALARWDYEPMRERWLGRLSDPAATGTWLLLAFEGLRIVREDRARDRLLAHVLDSHQPSNVRLAAARAVAEIFPAGLAATARKMNDEAGSSAWLDQLLAVTLLGRHEDQDAIDLLKELAVHKRPTVAGAAFERLLDLDPQLVFDVAEDTIQRPDARMRRLGARALVAKGDVPAIQSLTPLMDDVNPGNRRYVTASLATFAEQESLREAVIDAGETALQSDTWRSLEQAALLLGHLDHKPAAGRLVELMDHERGEVNVSAAWALRRLKVPETFPQMLVKAEWHYERYTDRTIDDGLPSGPQCSQLFQAFGEVRYHEADAVMRKCVPKNLDIDPSMRAAACWALGYLYEGNPEEELVALLVSRVGDLDSIPPEEPYVWWMAAVALGRMRAKSAVRTLRAAAVVHGANSEPGCAAFWALEQITGEPAPPPTQPIVGIMGWFLEPARE